MQSCGGSGIDFGFYIHPYSFTSLLSVTFLIFNSGNGVQGVVKGLDNCPSLAALP